MSRQPARGFTLIEMLAVLAIVGLLVTAAMPLQALASRRLQEQGLRVALRELRTALDAYHAAYEAGRIARTPTVPASGWPATLDVLVQGVPLADENGQPRSGTRLYLLRRLPRDPFADPTLPAAATWAVRASDRPAGDDAAGRDVFDVQSRHDGTALDGSRYRDW